MHNNTDNVLYIYIYINVIYDENSFLLYLLLYCFFTVSFTIFTNNASPYFGSVGRSFLGTSEHVLKHVTLLVFRLG